LAESTEDFYSKDRLEVLKDFKAEKRKSKLRREPVTGGFGFQLRKSEENLY